MERTIPNDGPHSDTTAGSGSVAPKALRKDSQKTAGRTHRKQLEGLTENSYTHGYSLLQGEDTDASQARDVKSRRVLDVQGPNVLLASTCDNGALSPGRSTHTQVQSLLWLRASTLL